VIDFRDDSDDFAVCHARYVWRKKAIGLSCGNEKSAHIGFVGIERKSSAKLSVFGIFTWGVDESVIIVNVLSFFVCNLFAPQNLGEGCFAAFTAAEKYELFHVLVMGQTVKPRVSRV